jgi:hypothetical protein
LISPYSLDDLGWVPDDQNAWRHVLGNHRPSSDHGIFANGYSANDHCTCANGSALLDRGWNNLPFSDSPRMEIVGKNHMRADENLILDDDTGWYECERFDLASIPDCNPSLNFHVSGNLAISTNLTTIEVDIVSNDGAFPNGAIFDARISSQ